MTQTTFGCTKLEMLTTDRKGYAIITALFGAVAFLFFGWIGAQALLGFSLLVVLPFYLFFEALALDTGERMIFSVFAAITLFPSAVYWLGFVIPFTLAVFAASLVFFLLAAGMRILQRKKQTP